MIELINIEKVYKTKLAKVEVLKGVNLTIKEGEKLAIVGKSGSGKSTLLYNVSGMDKATAGEIYLDGKKINDMSEKELSNVRLNELGFIFQQMYMVNNLNVFDNIILPAYQSERKDRTKAEINDYARELMKKLSISEIAGNDINEVSGGQLQRACICRAIMNEPELLLADEPTGALNKSATREVMDIFTMLNQAGTSILLVTHDSQVASYCKRILYMSDGKIIGELFLGEQKELPQEKREQKVKKWLEKLEW